VDELLEQITTSGCSRPSFYETFWHNIQIYANTSIIFSMPACFHAYIWIHSSIISSKLTLPGTLFVSVIRHMFSSVSLQCIGVHLSLVILSFLLSLICLILMFQYFLTYNRGRTTQYRPYRSERECTHYMLLLTRTYNYVMKFINMNIIDKIRNNLWFPCGSCNCFDVSWKSLSCLNWINKYLLL
jgi:hypothetical protein